MTNHLRPSAGRGVAVHLLDPAQGRTLQTWQFRNQQLITIGRNDGNDVVLADPHVSRAHATIAFDDGSWRIVSIGRHGTIVNDRLISEAKLHHHTVFRLGTEGPTLRFDTNLAEPTWSETLDNIGADVLSMLDIDQARAHLEVEQISGDALFQELKDQSQRMKSHRADDSAT